MGEPWSFEMIHETIGNQPFETYLLELPPTSNSDHQDSSIFSRESRTKPSFVTSILGGG